MKSIFHLIIVCLTMTLYLTGCTKTKEPNSIKWSRESSSSQSCRKAGDSYTNSIGMTFVPIPNKPYAMQTTEVTIEQWFKVLGEPISWDLYSAKDNQNYPMTLILYWEITDFINTLNYIEKTNVYRLPSKSEWTHACRAGTYTKWHFGNNEDDLKENAWFFKNSGGNIQVVGQKSANPWGLFDMYGNAAEFTSTCGLYYSSDVLFTYSKNTERCKCYIVKGGSATSRANQMSDTSEYFKLIGSPAYSIGFRLVMDDPTPNDSYKEK